MDAVSGAGEAGYWSRLWYESRKYGIVQVLELGTVGMGERCRYGLPECDVIYAKSSSCALVCSLA